MSNAMLKVIEGFGLVAGLNEENETKIFVEGHYYDDYENGCCGFSVNKFSLFDAYKKIIEEMISNERRYRRVNKNLNCGDSYYSGNNTYFWDMANITITDKMVARSYPEDQYLGTKEEYAEHERERRREELEGLAKRLAAKFKVKLSSIAFIEKLYEAIDIINGDREHWNNPEVRAEEWAACMYSGGGSDVYYDDLNFVNNRYSEQCTDLWDILDWLREECPLLMCKYEEKKLREENKED